MRKVQHLDVSRDNKVAPMKKNIYSLYVLARGEFNIRGFQNKMIRKFIPDLSPASISRILKRLLLHGLVKKVARTHKYYLTKLGKAVITTGLKTRSLFIIPSLAGIGVSAA